MKVLILESDKLLARNLRALLEREGHSVYCNVDAQEAIISADTEKPDAIVMDLLLAGRSGAEFLYEFRSYPDWQGISIFILSSVPASEACASSNCLEELGIEAFFYKPAVSLSAVVDAIGQLTPAAI